MKKSTILVPTRVHPRVMLPTPKPKVHNLTPRSRNGFQTIRARKNKVMVVDKDGKVRTCVECGHDYTSIAHLSRRTMWAEWYGKGLPRGLYRCNNCYRRKYKQMKKLDNKKVKKTTVKKDIVKTKPVKAAKPKTKK